MVSQYGFSECGFSCNPARFVSLTKTENERAHSRVNGCVHLLCQQVTALVRPTLQPHCAFCLLLRVGTHPVSTFMSTEGFIAQGTMPMSRMFFVKKRSFPLGRIMCQKIFVRTVPKVSSLDWLSSNLLLKWERNKRTLVQFCVWDLEMLGGSLQRIVLQIVISPRNH